VEFGLSICVVLLTDDLIAQFGVRSRPVMSLHILSADRRCPLDGLGFRERRSHLYCLDFYWNHAA
jgi:hypothetical protein